jgi:aspartyl aminopeptidase
MIITQPPFFASTLVNSSLSDIIPKGVFHEITEKTKWMKKKKGTYYHQKEGSISLAR